MVATSGRTFVFNNLPMDQFTGEQFCNEMGGHLATYNSSAEQVRACSNGSGPAGDGCVALCLRAHRTFSEHGGHGQCSAAQVAVLTGCTLHPSPAARGGAVLGVQGPAAVQLS